MFFKKSSRVIFRNYNDFGYITDNRNFRYIKKDDNGNCIGDKILSESGAIFFSCLDSHPQLIDNIVDKIKSIFTDVDIEILKNDANEFYYQLKKDGFVVSGNSPQECDKNDIKFSYKNTNIEKQYIQTVKEKSPQDFLEEYFKGKPQLTNVHIEIISKCNEKCVHCYIPHENKKTEMHSNIFFSILEQCKNMNVLHITISGGEPFLHKDFCNFLKKCRQYNFSVNILSNLTLLSDDIIKEMKANPLLSVQTSLYAMDPNVHDKITQKMGSFKQTKKSIIRLIENDIPLQISCPILSLNKAFYSEVTKWADQYNINVNNDYVIIGGYNHDIKNLEYRLSIDEVKKIINQKVTRGEILLDKIYLESEQKKEITSNDSVCSVCHSSICIADNGNIYPCAGWQGHVLGNIKKTSLREIWETSEATNRLRALRRRDFPKCLKCDYRDFCTMCMVRNANESPNGDYLMVNEYYCNIAKYIKKKVVEWKKTININTELNP